METDRAASILTAMGGATRLRVLELLAANPGGLGAGDIARRLDVVQNTMSSQLRVLAAAGLVEARREGRSVVYVLVGAVISEVAATLARLARDD